MDTLVDERGYQILGRDRGSQAFLSSQSMIESSKSGAYGMRILYRDNTAPVRLSCSVKRFRTWISESTCMRAGQSDVKQLFHNDPDKTR